jgi:purine-nucleoside phosphorylase
MSTVVDKAVEYLQSRGVREITGAGSTGSGQNLDFPDLETVLEIPYNDIPGFGDPGVPGHSGLLRIIKGREGMWSIWTGRRHFYQGFSFDEIGFYIDISHSLGASRLVCVNAAGGLDPSLAVGDLLVIEKFRCFIPIPRHPHELDGSPWRETSKTLADSIRASAEECAIDVGPGSYAGVPGPTYETAAEVAWLRKLGCNVVGMSTVPELIRGIDHGMEVVALSAVANVHGTEGRLTHEEVVRAGERSAADVGRILAAMVG